MQENQAYLSFLLKATTQQKGVDRPFIWLYELFNTKPLTSQFCIL